MKKNMTVIILVAIAVSGVLFVTAITRPKSGAVRGFLPTGFKAEQLADQSSVGAKLFIRTCSQCHELPTPKIHTPQEWPPTVDRMLQRLRAKDDLIPGTEALFMPNREEAEHIAGYLVFHGNNPQTPLLTDAAPSAVLYRDRCSQCHLLPHPFQQTPEEWVEVVDRMQDHMRRQQKNPLTDPEKRSILEYLKQKARP
jgi:cytochrome c5